MRICYVDYDDDVITEFGRLSLCLYFEPLVCVVVGRETRQMGKINNKLLNFPSHLFIEISFENSGK